MNNYYQTPKEKLACWWSWLTADPVYSRYELNNSPYIERMMFADTEKKTWEFISLEPRFSQPVSFTHVLKDNYLRFTALAFFDRLMIIRQTSLFNSFHSHYARDTLSTNFQLASNNGLLKGVLRGNFLNFLQFCGVQYNALALSNKSMSQFIFYLFAFETILHPLDTIRTRWTADIRGQYSSLADVCSRTAPSQLFNGYIFKMAYTFIMGTYFTTLSADGGSSWMSTALLTAAYPFLTLKSIAQVANEKGTLLHDLPTLARTIGAEGAVNAVRAAYRGFAPFLILNLAAAYSFPQLWSKAAQNNVREKAVHELDKIGAISRGEV